MDRLVEAVTTRAGRSNIPVNDAAFNKAVPVSDLDRLPLDLCDKIIAINLTGPMRQGYRI